MTQYGTEVAVITIPNGDEVLTEEVISNIRNYEVASQHKRTSIRVRVRNKAEEMSEYLKFTDLIDQKRINGILVVRDANPASKPSFTIDYPKADTDGCYFVIKSYTEVV